MWTAAPFENWTIILFPYATGDFHAGTGEFTYTDSDGKEKILYHNGYINYTETMRQVVEKAGVDAPDTVVVTGYSAGGFAAALLADDIHLLFDSSTKDGDFAKMQNYFDTGVMEVDEAATDIYQQILKETIPQFRMQALAFLSGTV